MKTKRKSVCLTLIILILSFSLPVFAEAQEDDLELPLSLTVALTVQDVPAGAVMLDLLVPAEEAQTVDFNEKNGAALNVTADSEIAQLNADGYVSQTFRTASPTPENELKYDITIAVPADTVKADPARFALLNGCDYEEEDGSRYYDLRVTPGQENEKALLAFADSFGENAFVYETIYTTFPYKAKNTPGSLRAAYLSAAGEVLSISDACAVNGGVWFNLNGTQLTGALVPEMLTGNWIEIIFFAAMLLLITGFLIVVFILHVRRIKKIRRQYLPALFPVKGASSDPALKKKLQRISSGRTITVLVLLLPLGALFYWFIRRLPESPGRSLTAGLWFIFLYFGNAALNVVFHEAGHALVGTRTGFSVTAVQMGQFFFTRRAGKLRREKRNPPLGIAGFTALSPTEDDPARVQSNRMFAAGGCANLLLCGVWGIVALFSREQPLFPIFLMNAFFSLYFGLQNLVPAFSHGFLTDGMQIKYAGKSPEEKAAMLNVMRISAALYEGADIASLPEAWFRFDDAAAAEPYSASEAADGVLRLISQGEVERALRLGLRLIAEDSALTMSGKTGLLPSLLWCMSVCGWEREQIEAFMNKERRSLLLSSCPLPEQLPVKYAYELLVLRDGAAAEKTLALYITQSNRCYVWRDALNRRMIAIAQENTEGSFSE